LVALAFVYRKLLAQTEIAEMPITDQVNQINTNQINI
jgi:hypothetical protein